MTELKRKAGGKLDLKFPFVVAESKSEKIGDVQLTRRMVDQSIMGD